MRHHRLLLVVTLTFLALHQVMAAEPPASQVATVAAARKVLDLIKLPAIPGAEEPLNRAVGRISYNVKSNCQAAFEFHKKGLLALQWTEVPGSTVTEQYASGMFSREGFTASLSATPLGDEKKPGVLNVSIMLHGNVDLKKLPMPPGLKVVYVGPQVAMYSTEAPLEKTTAECRKLLLAQGWQPYGVAGDSLFLKQNAVRLTANIMSAPAQMGKTMVSFSAEQLSADIPAPAETVSLHYADTTKEVLFDTKANEEAIEKFYRETLTKAGWKATTDKTFKTDWKDNLIFRNEAKDLLSLEMYPVKDENVLRVIVKHQSAAEVEAEEKTMLARIKADKNKPALQLGKVSITLPAGAKLKEVDKSQIEFTLDAAQVKAASDALRKTLRDDGWKESVVIAEELVGEIGFTKGDQEISISYVNTGFLPAEFTIRGRGVELERVAEKK